MKNAKILYVLLIILDIALVGVCGFFYVKKDRQAPKISFAENNTLYYNGIDESLLLKGVGAVDKQDGDMVDRVVIEKILYDTDSNTAIVYYAVSDYSGNVAKASRVFDTSVSIKRKEKEAEIAEANQVEDVDTDDTETEDVNVDEDNADTDIDEDLAEEEESQDEPAQDIPQENENSDNQQAEETANEEQAQQAAEINALEEAKRKADEEGVPYLELSYSEYKIAKGSTVPWQDVIRTMRDDLQDYNYLFGKLVATEYDRHTPGVYPVTLFTTDASGNKSNTVKINIIVE